MVGFGSTMSVVVTLKVTTAPLGPVPSIVIGAGTVKTGGVVSTTVTENESVAVLPWASIDAQVTEVE